MTTHIAPAANDTTPFGWDDDTLARTAEPIACQACSTKGRTAFGCNAFHHHEANIARLAAAEKAGFIPADEWMRRHVKITRVD